VPCDWVYVNDFATPDHPKAISLPSGTARPLQKALETLVDDLATDIPALFESEQYQNRRSAFEQRLATRKQEAFEKVVTKSQERDVTILRTPMGFAIAGMRNGAPASATCYGCGYARACRQQDARLARKLPPGPTAAATSQVI